MTRTAAREIAVQLAYELGYSDCSVEEFLEKSSTETTLPSWRKRMRSTENIPMRSSLPTSVL